MLWKKAYLPLILRGEKTATRRRTRPMVRVGSAYRLRSGFFDTLPERIRVERLYTQRLGDMTEEDARREGSATLSGFAEEWEAFGGPWDPDEVVWVVEFRLEEPRG